MTAALAAARFKALGGVDTFECPVCLCNEHVSKVWAVGPCGHEVCRTCMVTYLNLEIGEAHVLELQCPASEVRKCFLEWYVWGRSAGA